ncbi:MAG: alpha/beta hydrolase [Planctomycetota bacterium]|nr:alpha/beta hydrolase [Planctomycetota bacterium]
MTILVTAILVWTVALQDAPALELAPCPGTHADDGVLCGTYEVFEDREARTGKKLGLDVIVLKATGPDPQADPIFVLAGGPGLNATRLEGGYRNSWLRRERDIVFVDQRGTGGNHKLDCVLPGDDGDLQSILELAFQVQYFAPCLEELQERANLELYTTPIASDDLDEVRAALGYEKINLIGGSYGTRASLVYMRRHPESVRTAILDGVAPIAFTNPLFHAWGSQQALELVFAECAGDPACAAAFPELAQELEVVLSRLDAEPARVTVRVAGTDEEIELQLTRGAFGGSLRLMLYYLGGNRRVPLLIHRAYEGDYKPFVLEAIRGNRSIRNLVAMGMLLCVTCVEDVARIDPETIPRWTDGTFSGDARVRAQIEICEIWPRGKIPEDYGDPVRSKAPTLVLSGTLDPVTPPFWGAEAASHLENGLHLVVPGCHGVMRSGACMRSIVAQFLADGSIDGLDTACIEELELPPFELP